MEIKILSIHGPGLKKEVKFTPSFITWNKTNRNKILCQDLIAWTLKIFLWGYPPEQKNPGHPPKSESPRIRHFSYFGNLPKNRPTNGPLLFSAIANIYWRFVGFREANPLVAFRLLITQRLDPSVTSFYCMRYLV